MTLRCVFFCLTVLTTDDSCLFEGIQINHGDVFRPTSILDDFTSDRSARDECVECTCDVSININTITENQLILLIKL